MTDILDGKVSDFDPAVSVQPTDLLYLIQNVIDKQVSIATIFSSIPVLANFGKQVILGGTPQILSNAGTITNTETITKISNTGISALAIQNGLYDGQIKIVICTAATNTSTLTGGNLAGASVAWPAATKSAILLWMAPQWYPLAGTATIT